MFDIVALGESLIDFSPSGKNANGLNLYEQNPGGAPSNVLATASKFGGNCAFIGKVGDDAFGHFLKSSMEANKINCQNMIFSKEAHTALAFIHLDDTGDRSFTFYRNKTADLLIRWEEIDQHLLSDCRIFHFGSLSLVSEPSKSTTILAAQYAKKQGSIISYDPNYRPLLWTNTTDAVKEILKPLVFTDLLKVNEDELYLLTDTTDLEEGAKKLLSYGVTLVIVTLGKYGCYFATNKCCGKVDTIEVDTIDTTGAGDAFWGTLLYQLREFDVPSIQNLTYNDLSKIIALCNIVGSLTTTKKGAIPAIPNKSEAIHIFEDLFPQGFEVKTQ